MVGKTSHKSFDVKENVIMRTYYQKNVLTFMCCANELFYVCLYLLYFTYGPLSKLSQLVLSQIVEYLTNMFFLFHQ